MTAPQPNAMVRALQSLGGDAPQAAPMIIPIVAAPWEVRPGPSAPPASQASQACDLPRRSTQRRKLWQLPPQAHCPVVGVCLPIDRLRHLVARVLGGDTVASDYELHCGVNAECRQRNRMSEALHKALDQRYAKALQDSARLKTPEALAPWWQAQSRSGRSVAGAFWAVLTHPHCTPALEEQVLQDIHMLQHQAGAAARVDHARLQALMQATQRLTHDLTELKRRSTQQALAQSNRLEAAQSALVRARADLIQRDTVIDSLREEIRRLEAAAPGLRRRDALAQQVQAQQLRIRDLERRLRQSQLALAHRQAQELARRVDTRPAEAPAPAAPAPPPAPGDALANQAVLCVGGRAGNVPIYRSLIEDAGGRFLHHDGGEEDSPLRLDQTLAAADLVICQTGCISHDAYWRVKAHCKRTGKRCVFVDTPSASSLKRALGRDDEGRTLMA